MAGRPDYKLRALLIKDYLERATDERAGVTLSEICSYLESEGQSAERKAIYSDIELLRRGGMDIALVREGRRSEYRLMSRAFQLAELKLLVDAVGASKFITRKKSLELIKKLSSLASERESSELRRNVYVERRVKTMNESIYYTVDAIHEAINGNKKLGFRYFDYGGGGRRNFRRAGGRYTVSPLSLNYAEENYYLFALSEEGEIRTYRVDRMSDAQVLKETRQSSEASRDFDPAAATQEMFRMYSGEKRAVELAFDEELTTVILDRFGDVRLGRREDGRASLKVDIRISPNFFGWIFGLGGRAELISPQDVLEEYTERARCAAEGRRYESAEKRGKKDEE
ncbi:MAG: WYL domain-containing protein [Oscillospiraceae bacterium]|nr:WYL domain-containing protein [Oscillospiraceae bacterium]